MKTEPIELFATLLQLTVVVLVVSHLGGAMLEVDFFEIAENYCRNILR